MREDRRLFQAHRRFRFVLTDDLPEMDQIRVDGWVHILLSAGLGLIGCGELRKLGLENLDACFGLGGGLGSAQKGNRKQTMQNKTDIKSMAIGAMVGAILVLSIAAATQESSHEGRFRLTASTTYLFKLDTTTGQVWQTPITIPSAEFKSANVK